MSYHDIIDALAADAEQLEEVYQISQKDGATAAFKQAIDERYKSTPDNLLYAAWFHRLKYTAVEAKSFVIAWGWVIPLAVINGSLFWWLSDERFVLSIEGFRGISRDYLPLIFLIAAPLAALPVLIYLTAVGRKYWQKSLLIAIILTTAAFYVTYTYPLTGPAHFQEQYLNLMALHLPLLAWAGVGVFLTSKNRDPDSRFSFLIKSLEIFVVGGLFFGVLGVFTAITAGLFAALDVNMPDTVVRLFFAGGAGFIAVVATAVVYNPTLPPAEQVIEDGFSKLITFLMSVLLPLTLLVLIVYLFFIPFNFRAPFDNRDVLITFNIMLFAIVVLLVGSTLAMGRSGSSQRMKRMLRGGIIAVATLTIIVGIYALAAILYRASIDHLTPNRLTFIGWNIINIGLLVLVLFLQVRASSGDEIHSLKRAFNMGAVAYAAWTVVVILAIPWLFGHNQENVEGLPLSVQRIIYEEPNPILLKCGGRVHIYLIEDGQKRWIDSIETFEERGYVWGDVHFINCGDLRSIPDGIPIPADAGPPPSP